MSEVIREIIKDKKRVVIKVGSSSLQHKETGMLDYIKLDVLVREICDLRNRGIDVILVSSGAIAVGRSVLKRKPSDDESVSYKQSLAAIGQARLMMTYQKIFSEYHHETAQILMTKNTILDNLNRFNAHNTFTELLNLGVVPVVNENDTVTTYEIKFGDNDTLSAIVAALVDADLLILLSDIDGLYTDDPNVNPDARFISTVENLDDHILDMGKGTTGSASGTGGMNTKLQAAKIATSAGADMIIANAEDMRIIHRIMDGREIGTMFKSNKDDNFYLADYIAAMDQD